MVPYKARLFRRAAEHRQMTLRGRHRRPLSFPHPACRVGVPLYLTGARRPSGGSRPPSARRRCAPTPAEPDSAHPAMRAIRRESSPGPGGGRRVNAAGPATGLERREQPAPRVDPGWHGEPCWLLDAEPAGSPCKHGRGGQGATAKGVGARVGIGWTGARAARPAPSDAELGVSPVWLRHPERGSRSAPVKAGVPMWPAAWGPGPAGTRTPDLCRARAALSQLSYRPQRDHSLPGDHVLPDQRPREGGLPDVSPPRSRRRSRSRRPRRATWW